MPKEQERGYKVSIIGGSKSGKTALVRSLLDKPFDEHHTKTTEEKKYSKIIESLRGGEELLLQISDLPNSEEEQTKSIITTNLFFTNAVVICVDLSNRKQISDLNDTIEHAKFLIGGQRTSQRIFVVGTKSDSYPQENIELFQTQIPAADTADATETSEHLPANHYFLVSAQTGENVKALFYQIVESYLVGMGEEARELLTTKTVGPDQVRMGDSGLPITTKNLKEAYFAAIKGPSWTAIKLFFRNPKKEDLIQELKARAAAHGDAPSASRKVLEQFQLVENSPVTPAP